MCWYFRQFFLRTGIMNTALVFLFALIAVVTASRIPRESKYTTKYDNIDLEEILKSDRLLNNYFNCLMGKGKCTPDGTELKKVIPDALETGCSKCNDKQRKGTERVITFLLEHKPDQFRELEQKYDPNGVYRKKYDEELKKRGLKA